MPDVDRSATSMPSLALTRRDGPPRNTPYAQTNRQPSSPVSRLSLEQLRLIMRMLFESYLQGLASLRRKYNREVSQESLPRKWKLGKARHPWITLQVCRLWRLAAMDYAGMWPMFVCRWQSPVHIVFPSIQHIRVIDEALCMSDYVWRYPLSPPATHRFTMFDENSAPIANSIRLLSIIYMTSQLSNLLRGPIIYLEFKANRGERPFHYLELTAHNAPFPDSSFKPLLNFDFECVNHGDVNPIWFQMLLHGLSGQLAYVQELRLTNMDAYKTIDWSELLKPMRSVFKFELMMDEDGTHPVVELLGSVVAERWDERTGTVQRELYLPHLDEFRLGMEDATGDMLELLIRSLRKRKEWGSPLRMLHISSSEDYPIEDPEESLLLQLVSSLEFEYL